MDADRVDRMSHRLGVGAAVVGFPFWVVAAINGDVGLVSLVPFTAGPYFAFRLCGWIVKGGTSETGRGCGSGLVRTARIRGVGEIAYGNSCSYRTDGPSQNSR